MHMCARLRVCPHEDVCMYFLIISVPKKKRDILGCESSKRWRLQLPKSKCMRHRMPASTSKETCSQYRTFLGSPMNCDDQLRSQESYTYIFFIR